MSRPLPLSAYLALKRGAGDDAKRESAGWAPRPAGPVIWMQVPDAGAAVSARAVADDLWPEFPDLTLLLTGPGADALTVETQCRTAVMKVGLPRDAVSEAHAFLEHWQPDALVWVGADLRPGVIDATRSRSMARLLVGPGEGPYVASRGFLVSSVIRSLLPLFDAAYCRSEAEAERLIRAGFRSGRVEVCGRFETLASALPVVESDYDDMANLLGTRPLWFVNPAHSSELGAVISAHRAAARLAHRLMLILASTAPADLRKHPVLADLKVADRTLGEDPTDMTDVLLTDTDEPGLWYRLAPVSFAGGTLEGGSVSDPYAAAALGSAIIHGPRTRPQLGAFERLEVAGATVEAETPDGLARRVEEFLSASRAAQVAHAAWDVVTAGAETTNKVSDFLKRALNDRPVR